MSEPPSVSVVVPTRDRPDQLPTCLDGIAKLDYPRDRLQVIVVDDSGGSATVEDVALDVELMATDRIGPAGARNAGVERAAGVLLAFIDDDCYPRPDWLARLVARWQEAPAEAVGGHTVNALSENVYAEAAQLVIDVGYAQNSAPERRWFTTNNLVMPAEGFRALGGFDASYRTAEDRDLCARWLESGRRMAYEPAAIMEHRRRVEPRRVRRDALSLWPRLVPLPPRSPPPGRTRRSRALVLRRAGARCVRERQPGPHRGPRGAAPRLACGPTQPASSTSGRERWHPLRR